jgi:hypothetical protein
MALQVPHRLVGAEGTSSVAFAFIERDLRRSAGAGNEGQGGEDGFESFDVHLGSDWM